MVRSTIDLPYEHATMGESGSQLHLLKCPPPTEASPFRIYDGWLELQAVEPEYVRSALAGIGVALGRTAFAFDAELWWRPKYRFTERRTPLAQSDEGDVQIVKALFEAMPTSADMQILESAIDWYNQGQASRNVLAAFLCHYIAVESVATAVADGKCDLGIVYEAPRPADRRRVRDDCIRAKAEILATDPSRFVIDAYFECVTTLRSRTEAVVRLVFGDNHPHVKALFERAEDGYSLSELRSGIAHGQLTLASADDERLVRHRVEQMRFIAKEFLSRLASRTRAGSELPAWSGRRSVPTTTADPRTILSATSEDALPKQDWQIRPEWCD